MLTLERNIDREVGADDPMVAFMVNILCWVITRLQPREHGQYFFVVPFGRHTGQIATLFRDVGTKSSTGTG